MVENASTSPEKSKKTGQYIIIGLIVAAVGAFLFTRLGGGTPATISGIVNFNGLEPRTQPNQSASIKLMQKSPEAAEFVDSGVSIPVADLGKWEWTTATEGVTYLLRADGYLGTQRIASSNIITATAPATGQILTFNIAATDLPEGMVPDVEVDTAVSVSGSITLNGYVPSGSTVTILGRRAGSGADYQPAVTRIPAVTGTTWVYDEAQAGRVYEYQAEMYTSAGTFIGQSNYITVTAPASNEVVVINSTAVSPPQKATISGTVHLNGPVAQNSTILMLQRQVGVTDYTVIDRYPARDNTTFSWAEATSGTGYDITAALQVNEQNTATGNVVTITAPADTVNITINTGVNLTPPDQVVSVTCGDPDSTNHFSAKIEVPQYENANTYYLEVGTSAGSNNMYADTLTPNATATIYITGQSPYFARYTYSECTDCDLSGNDNWAGWSPTLGFTCPEE